MKDKHGSVVGRYNVNSDRMLQCTSLLRSVLRQRERKCRYYYIAIGMFISEDPAKDGVNWHYWDAEAYAADYSMHKILCDLTDIWNNGNESQKQYAADLANTIRKSYSQRYEYNDIDGNASENTGGLIHMEMIQKIRLLYVLVCY